MGKERSQEHFNVVLKSRKPERSSLASLLMMLKPQGHEIRPVGFVGSCFSSSLAKLSSLFCLFVSFSNSQTRTRRKTDPDARLHGDNDTFDLRLTAAARTTTWQDVCGVMSPPRWDKSRQRTAMIHPDATTERRHLARERRPGGGAVSQEVLRFSAVSGSRDASADV